MKNLRCDRAWQAEAVENGLLSNADRASFERHAATCEVCAHEVRVLGALRDAGERLPAPTITPLQRRRLHNELLRRANTLALRSPRTFPSRPLAFAVVATAAAAALVLWLRPSPRPSVRPLATDVPTFEMTTSEGARWRTLRRDATLHLSVQRGTFDLAVDKLRADQRFLLDLPDGELEVKGTRFVVDVDGVRTQGVRVSEGRVVLRLRGQAAFALGAGQGWPTAAVAAAAPMAPRTPIGPDERRVPSPHVTRARDAHAEAPRARPSTAGADFAQAMSAFSAGDYGRAEGLFAAFALKHPEDTRIEDVTFLMAVARANRGDSGGAQALAREYLRRYPKGLRRAEAQRLSQ